MIVTHGNQFILFHIALQQSTCSQTTLRIIFLADLRTNGDDELFFDNANLNFLKGTIHMAYASWLYLSSRTFKHFSLFDL